MRNIFTELPDAVLRHALSPFLDYNGRLSLNACLPPAYRIGKQIKADAIIIADLIAAVKNLKKPLKLIGKLKLGTIVQANAVYRYLTVHIPTNLVLIRYDAGFRKALFDRLDYFSSDAAFKDSYLDKNFQGKMLAACDSLRALIDARHPFIRPVKIPLVDKHSFVDCLPQVYENIGCGYKRSHKSKKRHLM